MKVKRELIPKLRALSSTLPKETYTAKHKRKEVIPATKTTLEVVNWYSRYEEHEVNHFKRLKNAYKKYGQVGIDRYMSKYA